MYMPFTYDIHVVIYKNIHVIYKNTCVDACECICYSKNENLRYREFSLITLHDISCVLSFVRQKRHFDKYEVELERQRDFKLVFNTFKFLKFYEFYNMDILMYIHMSYEYAYLYMWKHACLI